MDILFLRQNTAEIIFIVIKPERLGNLPRDIEILGNSSFLTFHTGDIFKPVLILGFNIIEQIQSDLLVHDEP
jgi:hypothetical protein